MLQKKHDDLDREFEAEIEMIDGDGYRPVSGDISARLTVMIDKLESIRSEIEILKISILETKLKLTN